MERFNLKPADLLTRYTQKINVYQHFKHSIIPQNFIFRVGKGTAIFIKKQYSKKIISFSG
jgi:CRISPR/Cas system CMR-associated protein Cmr3 (group 5 of RAMP superfamily)